MKDLDVSHPLKRIFAAAIDLVLLNVVSQVIQYFIAPLFPQTPYTGSWDDLNAAHSSVMVVLFVLYFVLMEWAPWGATFGKLALGIRVVLSERRDARNDDVSRCPPLWRVVVRNAAKILVLPTFMISFLLAFVTPRRQALNDMLSGTTVITERYQF